MGSRSYAQVAPTSATIALNAYIFMYGGHSLVTPHATLKQLWWTDERIEAKIDRAFVLSKLRGQERDFLHRPLAFGEGLTDDTYLDWVLDRAKRLFLILVEIGVPDQIFGCIDASWTDDDLPLPLPDVRDLELAYTNDEALNQKFYHTQFTFLLRQLEQGAHLEYGPKEHIPMEYVNTWPPAVTLQIYDRVHFPGQPDTVFMRRKFALIDKDTGQSQHARFMHDVHRGKALSHEHIANLWASYTSEDAGYTMSDFVPEHTLATFMEHRTPPQYMRASVAARKMMLCEWMHCLADALAFLHDRGVAHTAVRPSHIWIDPQNRIAFADVGCLKTFQRGKKSPKTETYDYAPPESQFGMQSTASTLSPLSPQVCSFDAFSKSRHSSTSSASVGGTHSVGAESSTRGNSFCDTTKTGTNASPITPITPNTPTTPEHSHSGSINSPAPPHVKNFSRVTPAIPPTPTTISTIPTDFLRLSLAPSSSHPPESSADIFSLGCIFLDIITFLIKGKLTDFIKFRSTPGSQTPKSRPPTTAASSGDVKGDTSFHASLVCEPHKLDRWLTILGVDAARQSTQLHQTFLSSSSSSSASSRAKRGPKSADPGAVSVADPAHAARAHLLHSIPALLALVERMLALDPATRPSALDVRDSLGMILHGGQVDGPTGSRSGLCCEGREWSSLPLDVEGVSFGLEKRRFRHDGAEEGGKEDRAGADAGGAGNVRGTEGADGPGTPGAVRQTGPTTSSARRKERLSLGVRQRAAMIDDGRGTAAVDHDIGSRQEDEHAVATTVIADTVVTKKGTFDAATKASFGGQGAKKSSWKRAFVKAR